MPMLPLHQPLPLSLFPAPNGDPMSTVAHRVLGPDGLVSIVEWRDGAGLDRHKAYVRVSIAYVGGLWWPDLPWLGDRRSMTLTVDKRKIRKALKETNHDCLNTR